MFLKLTHSHWQKYMQYQNVRHSRAYGIGKKAGPVVETWKWSYYAEEDNKL